MKKSIVIRIDEHGSDGECDSLKTKAITYYEKQEDAIVKAANLAKEMVADMKRKGWERVYMSINDGMIEVVGFYTSYDDNGNKIGKYWNVRFAVSSAVDGDDDGK